MNGNLFKAKPLASRSFFQQLFRQLPEENAIIEVNNLFAVRPVMDIADADIRAIEHRYGLKLLQQFSLNMQEFYAVYLNYCLADKMLSSHERSELDHLKTILQLEDKHIEYIHARIGEIIYRESFGKAVAGGYLSREQEVLLHKLKNTLGLPEALAEKISAEVRKEAVERCVARIISDQRLSPAEEQELSAIAANLRVSLQLDNKTREQFRKLKLYWSLENLPLPVVQPDITIQKSEVCHFKMSAVNWFEWRSVRQRSASLGYRTTFRTAKGYYFQSTGSPVGNYRTEALKLIDRGTLYLTNKRIIFTGTHKNTNIRIDKILDLTPHTDGVTIEKETGKSPTLQLPREADVFCILLERLLNER